MHSLNSTTAPMPQGKYVENEFNHNLKCQAAQQMQETVSWKRLSKAPLAYTAST